MQNSYYYIIYPYKNEGEFLYFCLAVTEEFRKSRAIIHCISVNNRYERYYKVQETTTKINQHEDEEIALRENRLHHFLSIFLTNADHFGLT